MDAGQIEAFCLSLRGATLSVQWGADRVFKVGGKMFAVLGPEGQKLHGLSFKTGDDSFHILTRAKDIVPAPYLARAHWVLLRRLDALGTEQLQGYLSRAHAIVVSGLPKKKQVELGMLAALSGSSMSTDILALTAEDGRAANVRSAREVSRELKKRAKKR